MMQINKKRLKKILLVTVIGLLMLPVLLFGVLYFFVLTPSKLTPLVTNMINGQITGHFECEKIELTLSTYPDIGIKIYNARLLTSDTTFVSDTLIHFSNATLSIQPLTYLLENKIITKELTIKHPTVFFAVNEQNKTNWDIFSKKDTTNVAENDTIVNILELELPRLILNDGILLVDNRPDNYFISLKELHLQASADFDKDIKKIDLDLGWGASAFTSDVYTLNNKLAVNIKGQVELKDDFKTINILSSQILLNAIPFDIQGTFKLNNEEQIWVDFSYGLQIKNLQDLLQFVPQKIIEDQGIKLIEGEMDCKGSFRGLLTDSIYPIFDGGFYLRNGLVKNKDNYGIDSLIVQINSHIDYANNDSSYINIDRIFIKNNDAVIDSKANLSNLWVNPYFQGTIKSNINFTNIASKTLDENTLSVYGNLLVDLQLKVFLNDLLNKNYGKIFAIGKINVDKLTARSKLYNIDAAMKKLRLELTTEKKIGKNNIPILSGQLNIDSLNVKYKDEINSEVDYLSLSLGTPSAIDTAAIVTIGGRLNYKNIKAILPDSTLIWSNKGDVYGFMRPSETDKKSPAYSARIKSDTLVYITQKPRNYALTNDSEIELKLTPRKRVERVRQQQNLSKAVRDSIVASRMRQPADTTLKLGEDASDFLRKWDMNGKITFAYMRIGTPYFPIRTIMRESSINFTPSEISLSNAKLQLGQSDMNISGKITNYRMTLARGRALKTVFNINSNFIDCNELLDAMSRGLNFSEREDSIAVTASYNLHDVDSLVQKASESEGVFQVPAYLDLELHTAAKKIQFNDLLMQDATGTLLMRDKELLIRNLTSISNIGAAEITMYYLAENKNKATFGLDMSTKKIQIDRLIDLIPSVDTIMPMLRSLEGIVDVSFTAKGELDSTMSVVFPSFEATGNLQGANVVLLDGETFTEIAKKLKFKNKNRNRIDSIAAEIMIKDSKLEVFPFLMEMDRYRVAIGGTHNIDLTYNYHISVLKSPLPFKIGLNVTGDENDFKFKIGKAKYKDVYKAAHTGTIDHTNINLKNILYINLLERIKERTGSPLDIMPSNKIKTIRLEADSTLVAQEQEDHEFTVINDSIIVMKSEPVQ